MDKYSAVKVGGFRIGDFPSVSKAKKAIKDAPYGFYQVIDNNTGYAVWEGNN